MCVRAADGREALIAERLPDLLPRSILKLADPLRAHPECFGEFVPRAEVGGRDPSGQDEAIPLVEKAEQLFHEPVRRYV